MSKWTVLFWLLAAGASTLDQCFAYDEEMLLLKDGRGFVDLTITLATESNPDRALLTFTENTEGFVGFTAPRAGKDQAGQARIAFRAYFEDIRTVKFRDIDSGDKEQKKGVQWFQYEATDTGCTLTIHDYAFSSLIRHGLLFRGEAPKGEEERKEAWDLIRKSLQDTIRRRIVMPGKITKSAGFGKVEDSCAILDWSRGGVENLARAYEAPPIGVRKLECTTFHPLSDIDSTIRKEIHESKGKWKQLQEDLKRRVREVEKR